MSTNLTIFGNNYTDVAGIKAEDSNGVIHTFTEGGGSTLPVTGTFTPASSTTSSVTINTNLPTINYMLILPTENPYDNSHFAIYLLLISPANEYQKGFCVRGKGTEQRGFEQWIAYVPPWTISGGTINISFVNASATGYFGAVEYKWIAW